MYTCDKFQMSFLPSMYGVEFCIALAGNCFALWLLVVRERRNWHTGIVLSCNLAISDLLYVLTLPLLIVYYIQKKDWIFGKAVCKIERFLFTCNLYVSIFFIMAISVNRCVAIIYPFFSRSYVRPLHAKGVSVLIWIVVASMSSPVLYFASTFPASTKNTLCVSHYNNTHSDQMSYFTYQMFLAVFGCLVPFLVTFTSYCLIIWVVWKNTNITRLEKQKIAIMVVSVIILYSISFVPYHVFQSYNGYLNHHGSIVCWVYNSYQVSKVLATLNMCIHPFFYMSVFDSIRIACCRNCIESRTDINNAMALC